EKTYTMIENRDDYWAWFKGPFLDGINMFEWYDSGQQQDPQTYFIGQKLIGAVALRQVRRKNLCSGVPKQFSGSIPLCYRSWEEEREPYGPNNTWTWSPNDQGSEVEGRFETYP